MKLVSMTDKVLEQKERNDDLCYTLNCIYNYANFLKLPLEIGMFVPCDEDGNVLEEKSIFNTEDEDCIFDSEAFDNYKKAKERVIFEGFEYSEKGYAFKIENRYECRFDEEFLENTEIEDLIPYNLTITASAIKKYNL